MAPARVVAFDERSYPHALDAAIAATVTPPTPHARMAQTWARDIDREWWGPREDPGGDALRIVQGDRGPAMLVAGRPVPAWADGDVVHVGYRGRIGRCVAWALTACERVLAKSPECAATLAVVFARTFGEAGQSFAEYQDAAGRWHVLDLTLDDREPFDRGQYERALHIARGTRIPIPDRASLDELRAATQSKAWGGPGARAAILSRLAPALPEKE
jgi:hypothetical protein